MNTFADILMLGEPLLEYSEKSLRVVSAEFRPASMQLGKLYEWGVRGTVTWEAEDQARALSRLVNVLVDYAAYCGTDGRSAQGMGQTVRLHAEKTNGPTFKRSISRRQHPDSDQFRSWNWPAQIRKTG